MIWLRLAFLGFVLLMLALNGIFYRHYMGMAMKEALAWSEVWIILRLAFAAFIYFGSSSG